MKLLLSIVLSIISIQIGKAQNFKNGDLEYDSTEVSAPPNFFTPLPNNWQIVPNDDINSLATSIFTATSDVLWDNGLVPGKGMAGKAFNNKYLVAGIFGKDTKLPPTVNSFFQEGLMQTVSGFVVGCSYKISFYQSVVKLEDFQDNEGSWLVIADSTIIDTTISSYSDLDYKDVNLIWEKREITFTPVKDRYTFKFLPYSLKHLDARVYMGIDLISITPILTPIDLGFDTQFCADNPLTVELSSYPKSTYTWQDGSNDSIYVINSPGTYHVEAVSICGSTSDTVVLEPSDFIMPNVFTPNNDGLNDYFIPSNSDCYSNLDGFTSTNLSIYNRWGTKIFETDDVLSGWDGKGFNDGIYYWYLTYSKLNGELMSLKGHVTMLR